MVLDPITFLTEWVILGLEYFTVMTDKYCTVYMTLFPIYLKPMDIDKINKSLFKLIKQKYLLTLQQ